MKQNNAAIMKRLEQIEEALQQITYPQIVVQCIDEEPEAVLERMIAAGEIAEAQRDDVLVIRTVIVDPPNRVSCDMQSQAELQNNIDIQILN